MNRLFSRFCDGPGAFGLLFLRVVCGIALLQHGWPKIQHAFSWMGPDSFAPPILQALAAFAEFGGGIALVVGLLTPIASFGVACTMAVAVVMVHLAKGDPWVSSPGAHGGSFESALGYFAVAILLMLIGPGVYSLDWMLFRKRKGEPARTREPMKTATWS